MDTEPFVPTPEKTGTGGAASDTLTAFKRNLFTSSKEPSRISRGHNVEQHQEDCFPNPEDLGNGSSSGDDLRRKGLYQHQKGSFLHQTAANDTQNAASVGAEDIARGERSFGGQWNSRMGKMASTGNSDSLPAADHLSQGSHDQDKLGDGVTPTAPPPAVLESAAYQTPLKAKRADLESGSHVLFTPPPAPVSSKIWPFFGFCIGYVLCSCKTLPTMSSLSQLILPLIALCKS